MYIHLYIYVIHIHIYRVFFTRMFHQELHISFSHVTSTPKKKVFRVRLEPRPARCVMCRQVMSFLFPTIVTVRLCFMTSLFATWLIYLRHDSLICDMTHWFATWLIHLRHDSFICDMTHSFATWLIHLRHDSFTWDLTHPSKTKLIHMTWHIHMRWLVCIYSHTRTHECVFITWVYATRHTHLRNATEVQGGVAS